MQISTDLVTILQVVRRFGRSGTLRAEVPEGLARLARPCIVVLDLTSGEVTTCLIKDRRGVTLLIAQEALRTVSNAGKLNWVFTPSHEEDAPGRQIDPQMASVMVGRGPSARTGSLQAESFRALPTQASSLDGSLRIPRRTRELRSNDMRSWPRRHRQVYVLVDNVRDVTKIAAILSLPPPLVEGVLREIERTGAIVLLAQV